MMKTMSDYTIYCTEEQTCKASELGAPIKIKKHTWYDDEGVPHYDNGNKIIPTVDQMIGWLEEQGLYFSIECIGDYVYEVWTKDKNKSKIIINSCINTRKKSYYCCY